MRNAVVLIALAALFGCAPAQREALDRTPPSASCDGLDPVRCQLPWPSNAFTVADASTQTGLRLALDDASLRVQDNPACLERMDGFSRVTGVAVGIEGEVDPAVLSQDPLASLSADAPLQVITIQADHPDYGKRHPFRTESSTALQVDGTRSIVIGRPADVLPANADHALVALDALGDSAPRGVRVALGLESPRDEADERLRFTYGPIATRTPRGAESPSASSATSA